MCSCKALLWRVRDLLGTCWCCWPKIVVILWDQSLDLSAVSPSLQMSIIDMSWNCNKGGLRFPSVFLGCHYWSFENPLNHLSHNNSPSWLIVVEISMNLLVVSIKFHPDFAGSKTYNTYLSWCRGYFFGSFILIVTIFILDKRYHRSKRLFEQNTWLVGGSSQLSSWDHPHSQAIWAFWKGSHDPRWLNHLLILWRHFERGNICLSGRSCYRGYPAAIPWSSSLGGWNV